MWGTLYYAGDCREYLEMCIATSYLKIDLQCFCRLIDIQVVFLYINHVEFDPCHPFIEYE